jgi:hypothetical protein
MTRLGERVSSRRKRPLIGIQSEDGQEISAYLSKTVVKDQHRASTVP